MSTSLAELEFDHEGVCFRADDVDREKARQAHYWNSQDPERAAHYVQHDYLVTMRRAVEQLAPLVTCDGQREVLVQELLRFKTGYLSRLGAVLGARSRTASSFVTGPSNFPTARNQKALAAEQRRSDELLDWHNRALAAIKRDLGKASPEALRDPVDVLCDKIATAEAEQLAMKVANDVVRRKNHTPEEKVRELQTLNFTEERARKLLLPDFRGRLGFPPYLLRNAGARIRDMKLKLEELQRAREDEDRETAFEGGTVLENVADDRLQIFFEQKPDAEMIARLKSRGFRWAPSVGAWQRQRTLNARYAAGEVLAVKLV